MDYSQIYTNLKTKFPNMEIHQNHPLAPYTTLKIGGPADIFIHTKNSFQLKSILQFIYNLRPAHPAGGPTIDDLIILGNGSNVLISDSGIHGIVIKNESNEIEIMGENKVKVASGTQLSSALNFLAENKLSGLEEFAYIPSTIGGAIYGNIHSFEKNNFSSILESIEVFDLTTSKINTLLSSDLKWDYDESFFQQSPNLVILSAILHLKPGNSHTIKKTAQDIIEIKNTTQLMNSAGCVFKNLSPEIAAKYNLPISAGQIIDQRLGLKGKQIDGAQISPLHANFIVNTDSATAKDYYTLAKFIQDEAEKQFGIKLEFEVKFLGEF